MSRLPIRIRVTLAFAATLFVVLAAVGTFLYLRFDHDLTETLDRGLQARAGEIQALVRRSPEGLTRADALALEGDESVAQVLRADGGVVAGTGSAREPLLSDEQVRQALRGEVLFDRPGDEQVDEGLRVLASAVQARGETLVTVVGASVDEKEESVSTLLTLELVGLGAALILASAAGYFMTGAALRPVEQMRARAEEITDGSSARLPEPEVDDELGRLATTLNAMLDRMARARAAEREAIETQRRFVADASHELRTPLAILKGEIEVALLGDRSPEELRAALRSGGEEADRLIRLAEGLLLLSQSDEDRLRLRPETIGASELMRAVVGRSGAAGARVEADIQDGLSLTADRLGLEQALINLLDNASRHGGGDIELSVRADGDDARIAVRDHGPGFGDGLADRAFDRFTRGDAARTGPGAGLGLAIVRAVAQAHGGTVTVSDASPGARVELVLPHAVVGSASGHT